MVARAYDDRGRSHKVTITPLDLFDLMLVTDYIPPLRAMLPIAVRSALEGDGALLARMIRDSGALDVLGSPRDFSTARYATVCETEPMPWDAGTPIDQRPAVVQQRIAALPADTFAPFDPPIVVEDEIDLCLRWPDVPRPPSTAAPLPYPTVPTLILQGGEDLRTPPEVSARVAARIPGSVRIVVPGPGHSTVSDPRTARAAIDRFIAGKSLPKSPCKRIPTGIPAVLGAPSRSIRCASRRAAAQIGRTVSALGATLDDLRLVLSPAALATSGGGLRGGSWSIRATAVLEHYEAVTGVTVTGSGERADTLRVAGSKAARGTVTLRSGGRLSGTLGGRKISLDSGRAGHQGRQGLHGVAADALTDPVRAVHRTATTLHQLCAKRRTCVRSVRCCP